MSRRVIGTLAIWLVLLAVSPFTAPFSTCDLTVPVTDASAAHGDLWVKPASDTDNAPAVASAAELSVPLFDVIADTPVAIASGPRPFNPSRLILRI